MFYIQPRCENVKSRAEFFFDEGGVGWEGGKKGKGQTLVSCEFREHENRTACIAIYVAEPYSPKTIDDLNITCAPHKCYRLLDN